MRGRYRNVMVATGVLGLLATGCGGDDDSAATTVTAAAADDVDDPAENGDPDVGDPDSAPATTATTATTDATEAPTIVATTTIWGDVTRNVVCGNLAEVVTVVPPGVDAHQYEPSLQDRGLLGDAALVVANGLFLEEGLEATLDAVESDGVLVFRVADHIGEPIEFDDDHDDDHDHGHDDDGHDDHGHDDHGHDGDDHGHDDDDHGHDGDDHGHDDHGHDGDDPHVWFDPARVAAVLPELGEAIVEATGLDEAAVDRCVADYQDELVALDAELADTFATIPDDMRVLVTSHESLGYLADRYDFDIVGTVIRGTSSLAETNPADLEDLAQAVIATGVPAVFAGAESSQADIDALAARAGVDVVVVRTEALGEPGTDTDTYVDFLRTNAGLIADALS